MTRLPGNYDSHTITTIYVDVAEEGKAFYSYKIFLYVSIVVLKCQQVNI